MTQQEIKRDLTQQDIDALERERRTLTDKLAELINTDASIIDKKKNKETLMAIADDIYSFSMLEFKEYHLKALNGASNEDCELVALLALKDVIWAVFDEKLCDGKTVLAASLESARYLAVFNRVRRLSVWGNSKHCHESYKQIALSLTLKIIDYGLPETLHRLYEINKALESHYMLRLLNVSE